jgi:hypothetical protein
MERVLLGQLRAQLGSPDCGSEDEQQNTGILP